MASRTLKNARQSFSIALPRVSGVLMLGVFSLNAYIGLKDTVLSKLQPTHEGINFFFALLDLAAASILIYYADGRRFWVLLGGVVWPVTYLVSLVVDLESRMCLFSGQNCFSSVYTSFEYLILGEARQGWLLWPYTMIVAILLLVLTIGLSIGYSLVAS
jgi:hypothetical protein